GDEAAAGRREGRRGGRGRSGEGAADRRPGGKPKGKGRSFADGGKRRDGAGGGKPGASHKSAPAPRKQALDPDSPFAKLAALKADLEKKPRDKT
ncbi:hypothetical protein, partial [Stappia indica]|uniref:hypothetical protein n=1 Tax=Stappia indica TaxID=538381 RepID=UPI001CD2ACEA